MTARSGGDGSERRLWGIPSAVWVIGWVSFFTDTASEMVYPLLPLFLTAVLGAGAMSLGIIEGIAEAVNSILRIVSGRVTDRTGRPKPIVVAGYSVSALARPFIGFAGSWVHVLGIRFADRLGKGIRGAPRDAMLAGFAGSAARGRVYGFHRAMDHAGAVLGPLLAAAFLYFYPGEYQTLFALTIIPGAIVIILVLAIPEPGRPARARRAPETHPIVTTATRRLSAAFFRALGVIFLFGLGNASDAFLLLRLSDLGIAAFWIPLLWSGLHVVKVLASLAGGELSDRFGRRRLIAAGWLFYAAVYAGFAFVDDPGVLIAIFLAYGVYFGLTEGVEKAWIADMSLASYRGTAFGYYHAANGVSALLASLLFGFIWTRVSPPAAFLTGAGLAVTAMLLLYSLFSHEADSRHQ